MKKPIRSAKPKDLTHIFEDGALIDKALGKAVREALLRHKRAGNPVATWRNGQVVWIPPEDI
jgi:hypothetical protein